MGLPREFPFMHSLSRTLALFGAALSVTCGPVPSGEAMVVRAVYVPNISATGPCIQDGDVDDLVFPTVE